MFKSLSFLGLLALLLLSASAPAATLLSENFNALTPQLTVTAVGAFAAIDGTNVDIINSLCVSPESGNCIDMDGSFGNSQGILSTVTPISLVPGVTYNLSFDLIGSQRGNTTSTTVTFGPYSNTFSLTSSDDTTGIVNVPLTVSSVTAANLIFTSNTPGNVGAVLDNVLITSGAVSGVPEPASLGLFALALTALAAGYRLRKTSRG